MSSVIIKGVGSYVPEKVLTNEDLSKIVDTSDEWIVSRSGIKERRFAADGQTTSDMAFLAAKAAIENAGLVAEDIDLILVATITPDMPFPSTACLVQHQLGLKNISCLDVEAACSGFVYGLEVGKAMLLGGRFRNALVIGAEKLSSIMDFEDRTTCVLFGDGAGAVVLSKTDEPDVGILGTLTRSDGSAANLLHMPAGGSATPATADSVSSRQHFLKMNGKEIFKVAVRLMEKVSIDLLEELNMTTDDIDCVVPHQANIRILDTLAGRLNIPTSKFFNNIERYGNTSAASIPIALDEAVRAGKIKSGDHLFLVAFGAGLTWGSCVIKWK